MENEIRASEWWICGPASYTIPVLPSTAPDGFGFVYALLFSTGNLKIGKSRSPRARIIELSDMIETYGDVSVRVVALSHPRDDYHSLEANLHREFNSDRIKRELFRCDVASVASAIAAKKPVSGQTYRRSKVGRRSKPWYWTQRGAWYTNLGGRRIRLAENEEMARLRLAEMLQEELGHGKTSQAVGMEG